MILIYTFYNIVIFSAHVEMCWCAMPPSLRRFPLTTLSTVIIIIIIGLDRPKWSDVAVCQGRYAPSRLIVDGCANESLRIIFTVIVTAFYGVQ